jgi:hypothetical protein
MENRLKEIIRGIVKEIQSEKDLEEATGTGAVAGYNTPNAFSRPGQTAKKNQRLAQISGGEVVDDLEEAKILNLKQEPSKPVAAKDIKDGEIADISGMALAENRWLAIKNEEGSVKSKLGKGISSIHNQLSEVEKFVNWYSKLKTENGVKKEDYYKRTHKSLGRIKERLMNLSEKIRTL